jgi:hypothetical protein
MLFISLNNFERPSYVGGGVKVVEKRRFENPAWVSLE